MPAAFVAVYLLVLQSALGAFAFGAGPDAAQLDAFGNVICTHEGAGQRPAGDQQHQHDCCLFGCNLTAFGHGALPVSDVFIDTVRFEDFSPAVPASDHVTVGAEWSQSNPRAPPSAA